MEQPLPAHPPIDVSQIVGTSFRIYTQRWRPHVVAAAVAQLPALVPTLVLTNLLLESMLGVLSSRSVDAILPILFLSGALLGVAFLSTFLFVLMSGAVCQLVADWLDERPVSVLGAYVVAGRKFWRLAGAMLGVFAIALGALVALWAFVALFYLAYLVILPVHFGIEGIDPLWFIIPSTLVAVLAGIVLVDALVRWSVFVQAVIVEDRGPLDALVRSSELVRRNWWRTAGAMALLVVVPLLLMMVVTAVVTLLLLILVEVGVGSAELANSIAIGFSQVIFSPVPAIGVTILFYRLRDGADIWERIRLRSRGVG